MSHITFGVLSGIAFAAVTFLLMLPMKWNSTREKTEAIVAGVIERFAIGFVVVNVQLVSISPLNGLVIGIAMSIPSAIVTRAYVPVIVVGGLGSAMIGFVQALMGT